MTRHNGNFSADTAVRRRTLAETLIGAFLALGLLHLPPTNAAPPAETAGNRADENASVQAAFGKDCEPMLIAALDRAEHHAQIAIYSFTRRNISAALVRAVERGVKVQVKYDEKSAEWPGMRHAISYLKKRGVECVPIRRKDDNAKMHHKFAVLDGKIVLTGSFNYSTPAATASDENLVQIVSEKIAGQFAEEFERIQSR